MDAHKKLLGLAVLIVASLAFAPAASAHSRDRNRDGLPDRWEKSHHLSLRVNEARRDQDRDGLNNRGEYQAGLDPRDSDTDNDGIEDGNENAGTIASFANGVLTINLAGGGTLTGTVDQGTELECDDATASGASDEGDGNQQGGDGNQQGGDDDQPGGGDDEQGDDDHEGDNGGNGGNGSNCGADALTAGRKVKEGELKTANGGAVWEKLEL